MKIYDLPRNAIFLINLNIGPSDFKWDSTITERYEIYRELKFQIRTETEECGLEVLSQVEDAFIRLTNLCYASSTHIPISMTDSATLHMSYTARDDDAECVQLELFALDSQSYSWHHEERLYTFVEKIEVEKSTFQVEFMSYGKIAHFPDGENLVFRLRDILMRLSNR